MKPDLKDKGGAIVGATPLHGVHGGSNPPFTLKEKISKKFEWGKNADTKAEAFASNMLKYVGNNTLAERHNEQIKEAIEETAKEIFAEIDKCYYTSRLASRPQIDLNKLDNVKRKFLK